MSRNGGDWELLGINRTMAQGSSACCMTSPTALSTDGDDGGTEDQPGQRQRPICVSWWVGG